MILNMTQHKPTPDQLKVGVFDYAPKMIGELLTFSEIPSASEMAERARTLTLITKNSGAMRVMIGGAPFFMSTLERALKEHGIQVLYAFSVRESVEKTLPDGSVVKSNVFKHVGFVEV